MKIGPSNRPSITVQSLIKERPIAHFWLLAPKKGKNLAIPVPLRYNERHGKFESVGIAKSAAKRSGYVTL
ncbi:MAG: hypothetical protein PWK00_06765 [Coxiella burnetii]|nr:hypothetical protein [Coxiella burnetii]